MKTKSYVNSRLKDDEIYVLYHIPVLFWYRQYSKYMLDWVVDSAVPKENTRIAQSRPMILLLLERYKKWLFICYIIIISVLLFIIIDYQPNKQSYKKHSILFFYVRHWHKPVELLLPSPKKELSLTLTTHVFLYVWHLQQCLSLVLYVCNKGGSRTYGKYFFFFYLI